MTRGVYNKLYLPHHMVAKPMPKALASITVVYTNW